MILKPNLMCLPLNDQGQFKTVPQSPGENMPDASVEGNCCSLLAPQDTLWNPGQCEGSAVLKHGVVPPYKRLVRERKIPDIHTTATYASGQNSCSSYLGNKIFPIRIYVSNSPAEFLLNCSSSVSTDQYQQLSNRSALIVLSSSENSLEKDQKNHQKWACGQSSPLHSRTLSLCSLSYYKAIAPTLWSH